MSSSSWTSGTEGRRIPATSRVLRYTIRPFLRALRNLGENVLQWNLTLRGERIQVLEVEEGAVASQLPQCHGLALLTSSGPVRRIECVRELLDEPLPLLQVFLLHHAELFQRRVVRPPV